MCGIITLIAKHKASDLQIKHRDMFTNMLFMDQLRGEDATGVYGVNKFGNVEWNKAACKVDDFRSDPEVKKWEYKIGWDFRAMVGHNRKATKGAITDDNSHPFIENNIILVHNGTLRNHKELHKDVEVDSHAIVHSISKIGLKKTLEAIEGAFTLVIYDANKKEMHIVRNDERPLWMTETSDFWAFASEPWILAGGASRNGITLQKIEPLEALKCLTFDFNKENTVTKTERKVVIPKKVTAVTTTVVGSANTSNKPRKAKGKLLTAKPNLLALSSQWEKNDLIVWRPDVVRQKAGVFTMYGTHFYYPNVKVEGHTFGNKSFDDIMDLNTQDKLCGRVYSQFLDTRTNELILYVNEVVISDSIITDNGFEIDEEALKYVEKCYICHKNINDEEELCESVARNTKKGIAVICPTCVSRQRKLNPNWGKS